MHMIHWDLISQRVARYNRAPYDAYKETNSAKQRNCANIFMWSVLRYSAICWQFYPASALRVLGVFLAVGVPTVGVGHCSYRSIKH